MATHVTGPYNFGGALSERGLNRASAGLRLSRPEIFQKTSRIKIKAADPTTGDPEHALTVSAIVNPPGLQFNLFPVTGAPTLPEESFFVRADISFSLTDSVFGTVTRIGAVIEGAGAIIRSSDPKNPLAIRLLRRADGTEYLSLLELRGEHPDVQLIAGSVDAGAQIQVAYSLGGADERLARTFRAIVNYLVDMFLRDSLRRPAAEFQIPAPNLVVEFGPLGTLAI